MKIVIDQKKIKINTIIGFINRFKCLKFKLEPIDEGYLYPNHRRCSTYYFCQKVDIVMTDSEDNILYMYPNLKTEKRIHYKRRVYNTYILPLHSCEKLNIGEKLKIIKTKKDS